MSRLTEKVDQEHHICEKCKDTYYCPVHKITIDKIEKLDNRLWIMMGGIAITAADSFPRLIEALGKILH
jgi:hypothetical protein